MQNSKFEIIRYKNAPVTDEELLGDLRRVSEQQNTLKVTQKIYSEFGQYDSRTISRRFGSWNKALATSGLSSSNEINLPDEALFENILVLWQHYGRQPRRSEPALPPSTISQSPYNRRFNSWSSALENFVTYINATEVVITNDLVKSKPCSRQTSRDPSLRLRFNVLSRDHFTCKQCGASPAT